MLKSTLRSTKDYLPKETNVGKIMSIDNVPQKSTYLMKPHVDKIMNIDNVPQRTSYLKPQTC